MTDEQRYEKIIDKQKEILSKWTIWAIPEHPSCLFDKVIVNIARNPEWALKQNILNNNCKFWLENYDEGTRK